MNWHSNRILAIALVILFVSPLYAVTPVLNSRRSSHEVTGDTNPDSVFWRHAPAIFTDSDSSGRPVPGFRTEIRSRWTKKNLYFLFICPFEQLNLKPDPKTEVETPELWNWDVAEVFIGSDFSIIRRYREFEVSPQNEWIDLDINLDSPHHADGWTWNSGFHSATRIDRKAHRWYAFLQIPYRSIDPVPPVMGRELRVNFFLSEGPATNHQQIAWQPTHSKTFHVPEVFGRLRLGPDMDQPVY